MDVSSLITNTRSDGLSEFESSITNTALRKGNYKNMARTDLNHGNYWIKEQDGPVLDRVRENSVIESYARKENMTTDMARLKGVFGADPQVVAEGTLIPDAVLTFEDKTLEVVKYAELLPLSEEDLADASGDFIQAYKVDWFGNFATKYDNACLGVTAAMGTTTATRKDRPFNSVYFEANAVGNVTQTAGDLTLDDLNDAFSASEVDIHYNAGSGIIIAHPSVRGTLRVLKDSSGQLVFNSGQSLSGQIGDTLFGVPVVYSRGARTSAAQTSSPAGNPLIIFGDRSLLVNGVRSGPESELSREVDFKTGVINLKVQARRGFVVARPSAFNVVEITAGP